MLGLTLFDRMNFPGCLVYIGEHSTFGDQAVKVTPGAELVVDVVASLSIVNECSCCCSVPRCKDADVHGDIGDGNGTPCTCSVAR